MATSDTGTISYRDTLEAIARFIRRRRSAVPPLETARELLRYDRPGHSHLVGISDDGERAYLYHCEGRYVIAVGFDGDGLADGGPEVASFRRRGSVEGWVDRKGAALGWRHPRYR